MARRDYSYRDDPAVPAFDDATPIVIFDGDCALCSAGVQAMLRLGPGAATRFAAIQTPLATAIYRHYGLDPERFDTFMVMMNGRAHLRWRGVLAAARTLPAPWSWLGSLGRIIPDFIGDRLYDFVQRNRISWFGRPQTCLVPEKGLEARFM